MGQRRQTRSRFRFLQRLGPFSFLALACAATSACSESDGASGGPSTGDSEAGGDGPARPTVPRGRCAAGTRTGDFSVVREPDVTTVRGQVWDKAVSSRLVTEVASDGDCRLSRSENPRCSPSCDGSETCTAQGQCVVPRLSQGVGKVAISGLARPVEMEPLLPGNNYFAAADLPMPGFEPKAAIALTADGAGSPGFQLVGIGSEGLELPSEAWVLTPGQPFVVTWNAGSVAAAVVRVALNVDQHGTAPLSLSCETADDGELHIAASLVDALLAAGVTGFPSGHVNRETIDHAAYGAGCVELAIGAHVRRGLGVAGYTACTKAGDCPEGKTCNVKLQRCE